HGVHGPPRDPPEPRHLLVAELGAAARHAPRAVAGRSRPRAPPSAPEPDRDAGRAGAARDRVRRDHLPPRSTARRARGGPRPAFPTPSVAARDLELRTRSTRARLRRPVSQVERPSRGGEEPRPDLPLLVGLYGLELALMALALGLHKQGDRPLAVFLARPAGMLTLAAVLGSAVAAALVLFRVRRGRAR